MGNQLTSDVDTLLKELFGRAEDAVDAGMLLTVLLVADVVAVEDEPVIGRYVGNDCCKYRNYHRKAAAESCNNAVMARMHRD